MCGTSVGCTPGVPEQGGRGESPDAGGSGR
jgi:hypothetical protein